MDAQPPPGLEGEPLELPRFGGSADPRLDGVSSDEELTNEFETQTPTGSSDGVCAWRPLMRPVRTKGTTPCGT